MAGIWILSISVLLLISLVIGQTNSFAVTQIGEYTPPTKINPDTPIVSTRGHIKEGVISAPRLSDTGNIRGYDTFGIIPGFNDNTSVDNIVIYVHGWNNNEKQAIENFNTVKNSLKENNYGVPVIGYSWDSDTGKLWNDWDDATKIAKLNGPKLAQFILDYHSRSPNTKIHIIGHSLGSQVILNSIQSLHDDSAGKIIASVHLVGAAVDADAVSTKKKGFGKAITTVVDEFHNLYNTKDLVLTGYPVVAEGKTPLGKKGANCKPSCPPNYFEEDVTTKVGWNHSGYFKPRGGVINNVVKNWDNIQITDSRCTNTDYPYLWSDGNCYNKLESDGKWICPPNYSYLWSDGYCYDQPESDAILTCTFDYPYLWSDGYCYDQPESYSETPCPPSYPYLWSDGYCYDQPECEEGQYYGGDGYCYEPCPLGTYAGGDGYCYEEESTYTCPAGTYDVGGGLCCPDGTYYGGDGYCYDQ